MQFFQEPKRISKKINRLSVSLFSIFLSVLFVWLMLQMSSRYEANALLRVFFYEPFLDIQQIKEILLIFAPFLVGSLAVLICYKAGFINLNVSGQMAFTGLIVYIVGFYLKKSDSSVNWLIILMLIGIAASVTMSLIVAFLKIYFQINEVLTGIFLNYIVYYVYRSLIKLPAFMDPNTPEETKVGLGTTMAFNSVFAEILSISLLLSFIIFLFVAYAMLRSRFGFQLKVMNNHFSATRYAGINTERQTIKVFFFAGILSGIAGLFYYFRHPDTSKLFLDDALPSNGFDTLAIVWLAQSSFGALPFMALFISVLRVQQNTVLISEIDSGIVEILIGLLILSIAFGNQLYSDPRLRHRINTSVLKIKNSKAYQRWTNSKSSPISTPVNSVKIKTIKADQIKKRPRGES